MKLLILGGTTEASALARALEGHGTVQATLSLAGRTRAPVLPAVAARRGGFGGVAGLRDYLRREGTGALVDATHPFAARMSRNARLAAEAAGVPRLLVLRPEWRAGPGDRWAEYPGMDAAAAAIGAVPRRVFLTVGQQELAPFARHPHHHYLIRSVEPPDPAVLPPRARCIAARGPFDLADETDLLRAEAIELLVTKNSGGTATRAKLEAAQALRLPVILVARPAPEPGPVVADAAAALAWVLRHAACRGV